ncbi:MAG TPA: DUF2207 domain-containing protein [Acidimicrobiales bacterium]|nr:DUF2207 domain-containing protein [Acidimicrobiales bacterium]
MAVPRRRIVSSAVALAALALVLLVAAGGCVEERAFRIDAIEVDAEVRPDAAIEVTEQVTYTFSGADDQPFTVGVRTFEPGPFDWRITDIAAFDESGAPLRTLVDPVGQPRQTLFEWDIAPATSGTRTYELRYTIEGAVQVWSDVGELYWNWIGTTSPAVGDWSATITLPDGAPGLRAWAHGPLDGVVTVDAPQVRAQAPDIPEGQFVDTRIVVDADVFTVERRPEDRLDAIVGEEMLLAEQANAARQAARDREELREDLAGFATFAVVPLVVLAGVAFYLVWQRWGRDPKKPDDIGDYWREVPDDPPAVAVALLSWGTVGPDAFSATVVDLAQRGWLRITEETEERTLLPDRADHRFTKVEPPPPGTLAPFERRLITRFFGSTRDSISRSEITAMSAKDASGAQKFWQGFQKEVKAELTGRHYLATGKGGAFALHALIVAVLGGFTVFAFWNEAWIAGGIAAAATVVLLPLGILHRSRTPAGARRYHEWKALERYLRDFSRLDEAVSGDLILWERYLVAAVALGVADELLDGLRTRFPEIDDPGTGFATWYLVGAGVGHGRLAGMSSFSSDFAAPTVSSFTPSSSGSGGGGGFSAGGGGGGGGGGFGAR